jgi:hypothetical protein
MIKLGKIIIMTDESREILLPNVSPIYPNKMPPKGLEIKPMAKINKTLKIEERLEKEGGKKSFDIVGVR